MVRSYLELTKPRLTLLVLASALIGFFLAGHHKDPIHFSVLWATMLGASLVGGGANSLNQYFEKDADAQMKRTKDRPLPSGRLTPSQGLVFGGCLAVAGCVFLWLRVNELTAKIAVATLLSYLFCYTPLKKKTPLNTFIGAIPGALPTLMGWAARGNGLGWEAAPIFLILFFWQLPHFFAIAWVYREDYAAANFRMLTVTDPDAGRTGIKIVIASMICFGISFLPLYMAQAGLFYALSALLSGCYLVFLAQKLHRDHLLSAKQFVKTTIIYLLWVMTALIIDRAFF